MRDCVESTVPRDGDLDVDISCGERSRLMGGGVEEGIEGGGVEEGIEGGGRGY